MTSTHSQVSAESAQWLTAEIDHIEKNPKAIMSVFDRARRECGESDAGYVRTALLVAFPHSVMQLYLEGDVSEKLIVLGSLHLIDVPARPIIEDALRNNDLRVIGAALGPRSAELDDHHWRRAVLKFAYLSLPLSSVHGLDDRGDEVLVAMLRELVRERRSAGRTVEPDVLAYL